MKKPLTIKEAKKRKSDTRKYKFLKHIYQILSVLGFIACFLGFFVIPLWITAYGEIHRQIFELVLLILGIEVITLFFWIALPLGRALWIVDILLKRENYKK